MSTVMEEVHLTTIKPKNNVLLLAQEISFAKVLACNDKRLRDRGLRRLKKWFIARTQSPIDLTKEDLMRICKGLFYCMWMADKPLIQEELAENISGLVHSFESFEPSLLFVDAFFSSLSVEWYGIDQLRIDKFMMLVRRFLRQSLELVAKLNWAGQHVQQLAEIYERVLTTASMGLSMHFIEVFCEELAKVGKGNLLSKTVLQFILPFARTMGSLKDGRLISHITRFVFLHLIRQSELGIEHQIKFSMWKEYGFPGGDLDAAERLEEDDDDEDVNMEDDKEDQQVSVDARAGRVDVLLPPLDFDPRKMLKILIDVRNKKETTNKARKTLIQLISKFENLAEGKYPLGIHKVELPTKVNKKNEIMKAAKKLLKEEEQIMQADVNESKATPMEENNKSKNKCKKRLGNLLTWEVSESENNVINNTSPLSTSWNVSDSSSKERIVGENMKKNCALDAHESVSFITNDSKENISDHSPVASTPKQKCRSLLRKKTSISPSNSDISINKVDKSNSKTLKKHNKRKLNHNSDVICSDSKILRNTSLEVKVEDNKEQEFSTDIKLNTEKNNGWGGDWDEPSQDTEYEIFIPNKKYIEKRKSLGLPYPVFSCNKKSAEKKTPSHNLKRKFSNASLTPGSQKKVEFNLSANCSQEYKDYTKSLKRTKRDLPFDASKRPVQGLLKNSTPSPINPFYKKKLKL